MVPVVDLSRRGARFAEAFGSIVSSIAAGGHYLLGPELDAFETELASHLGVEHAVGVASGASAIQLALAAAGIGPGDEVVVPAFTAVPTATAVAATGAIPVVADVDPATACLTADTIDAVRGARTRAVVVVHLYGYPAPVPDASASGGLIVIEDAAQATGAFRGPRPSLAVAHSFYPTKNLGGIGDGGAVTTADGALAADLRRRRGHGMTEHYVHTSISQNFRMSEIEAAWLRLGIPTIDDGTARRREIAGHYRRAAPHLRWQASHRDHAYHLCVVRTSRRDAVRAHLAEAGVATAVHYPLALTQQPAFASLFTSGCPHAELWAAECVTVPCFAEMTDSEVEQVAAALTSSPSESTSTGVAR